MKKAFLLALGATSAIAAAAQPPQQIDIHNLPGGASVVHEVVIPVPTEIFGILDKIGKPHWSEVLRPVKGVIKPPGAREHTALMLGTIIAEGFIAVEAENAEEVKNIGRSVLSLSKAIGVEKSVVPRSKAIIEGADAKDWKEVRRELDKAQHDVQEAMRELNDEPLSQLVSLGGWLRGTEALAAVVKDSYNPDAAELLHQPVLLDYFTHRIEGLPKRNREFPLVEKMHKGLLDIRPLMGAEGAVIPKQSVDQIGSIAEDLNKSIHTKLN